MHHPPLSVPFRIVTAVISLMAIAAFPLLLRHFEQVRQGFEALLPGSASGCIVAMISIGFAPVLSVFCLLSAISGHDMFRVIALLLDPAVASMPQPRMRSER